MYENFPHGSLSIDFSDIISRAIRDGRDVRLDRGDDSGFVVVIDGAPLPNERAGFLSETFGWPLDDCSIDDEATELVDELAEQIEQSRTKARNSIPNTESHTVAEGASAVKEDA